MISIKLFQRAIIVYSFIVCGFCTINAQLPEFDSDSNKTTDTSSTQPVPQNPH